MKSSLFKKKKDLRDICREKYGNGFVEMYDRLNKGGVIGNFYTTMVFIEMVNEAKKEWENQNGSS